MFAYSGVKDLKLVLVQDALYVVAEEDGVIADEIEHIRETPLGLVIAVGRSFTLKVVLEPQQDRLHEHRHRVKAREVLHHARPVRHGVFFQVFQAVEQREKKQLFLRGC